MSEAWISNNEMKPDADIDNSSILLGQLGIWNYFSANMNLRGEQLGIYVWLQTEVVSCRLISVKPVWICFY
jgi:hypothetical protein